MVNIPTSVVGLTEEQLTYYDVSAQTIKKTHSIKLEDDDVKQYIPEFENKIYYTLENITKDLYEGLRTGAINQNQILAKKTEIVLKIKAELKPLLGAQEIKTITNLRPNFIYDPNDLLNLNDPNNVENLYTKFVTRGQYSPVNLFYSPNDANKSVLYTKYSDIQERILSRIREIRELIIELQGIQPNIGIAPGPVVNLNILRAAIDLLTYNLLNNTYLLDQYMFDENDNKLVIIQKFVYFIFNTNFELLNIYVSPNFQLLLDDNLNLGPLAGLTREQRARQEEIIGTLNNIIFVTEYNNNLKILNNFTIDINNTTEAGLLYKKFIQPPINDERLLFNKNFILAQYELDQNILDNLVLNIGNIPFYTNLITLYGKKFINYYDIPPTGVNLNYSIIPQSAILLTNNLIVIGNAIADPTINLGLTALRDIYRYLFHEEVPATVQASLAALAASPVITGNPDRTIRNLLAGAGVDIVANNYLLAAIKITDATFNIIADVLPPAPYDNFDEIVAGVLRAITDISNRNLNGYNDLDQIKDDTLQIIIANGLIPPIVPINSTIFNDNNLNNFVKPEINIPPILQANIPGPNYPIMYEMNNTNMNIINLKVITTIYHEKVFKLILGSGAGFTNLRDRFQAENPDINIDQINKLLLTTIDTAIKNNLEELVNIILFKTAENLVNNKLLQNPPNNIINIREILQKKLKIIDIQREDLDQNFYLDENYSSNEPIDIIPCINNNRQIIELLKKNMHIDPKEYQDLIFKLGNSDILEKLNTRNKITKNELNMYLERHTTKFKESIGFLNNQLDDQIKISLIDFIITPQTQKDYYLIPNTDFDRDINRKQITLPQNGANIDYDFDRIYNDLINKQKNSNIYLVKYITIKLNTLFREIILPNIKEFLQFFVEANLDASINYANIQNDLKPIIENIIYYHMNIDPTKSKETQIPLETSVDAFSNLFIYPLDENTRTKLTTIYNDRLKPKIIELLTIICKYYGCVYRNFLKYIFNDTRYRRLDAVLV